MEDFFHRVIKKSADGSHTFFLPRWQEHYHSAHGALSESAHVFIREGLVHWMEGRNVSPVPDACPDPVSLPADGVLRILEVGFGTGLNALLTLERIVQCGLRTDYLALEPYPLCKEEYSLLNLPEMVSGGKHAGAFLAMHQAAHTPGHVTLEGLFGFRLLPLRLEDAVLPPNHFDLVYHDAFAPQFQPLLWGEAAFARLYRAMRAGGVLTTYSAKGSVKRAMRAAGFRLEHPAGPRGKREMSRGKKIHH